MSEIEFNKQLDDGAYANFSAPVEVVKAMYPAHARYSRVLSAQLAYGITGFNTELEFVADGKDKLAVFGNTKTSTCPVATDCGSCALAGSGISIEMMSAKNCARANTARGFEKTGQDPEGRFMLLPLSNNVLVVTDESQLTAEYNGNELMQYRLPDAAAVVFTDSWLYSQGLNEASFAMNGADGSMGVARTKVNEELLYIPFCSMRTNMGDRGEDAQIIRKAINAYLDTLEVSDDERQGIINGLKVEVLLSASAELKNFAHKIQVPEEGSKYDLQLREKYPELIERAGGKITSAIVLNDQYPGAFSRGSIYPQFEAEIGIHESPITPDNCPGDGQTCHIDYRTETEYAIRSQLEQMGVSSDNIIYDDSHALDPASPDNNMASNRREQNNGVPVSKTMRTLNGVQIEIEGPELVRDLRRAAEHIKVGLILDLPLDRGMPSLNDDPIIAIYQLRNGLKSAPPRSLWDTVRVRREARAEGLHPMVYWLSSTTLAEDIANPLYDKWINEVRHRK